MLNHLQEGYAASFFWNVAYMAFSKELVRKIGWWDERFINGGWEDRDWAWRLAEADLSLYESQESTYDYTWKSPLNIPGGEQSTPHWLKKWNGNNHNVVIRTLEEEKYQHWDLFLGDSRHDISNTWTNWISSKLNIKYGGPGSGPSASQLLANRPIIKS